MVRYAIGEAVVNGLGNGRPLGRRVRGRFQVLDGTIGVATASRPAERLEHIGRERILASTQSIDPALTLRPSLSV